MAPATIGAQAGRRAEREEEREEADVSGMLEGRHSMAAEAGGLAQIAAEVQVCTKCDLHIGAQQGVPGSGAPQAEVMLIGEAPSYYDDRRGYPFSGPSGAFLDELLGLAGLSRAQVYLTNVV